MKARMRLWVSVYTLTVVGLFLPSCLHKNNSVSDIASRNVRSADEWLTSFIREQEARLDVPFPRGCMPLSQFCGLDTHAPDTVLFGFESDESCDDLLLFYTRSMEHWRLLKHVSGVEHLLIYTRPRNSLCTISLRPHPQKGHGSLIMISVGKGALHG